MTAMQQLLTEHMAIWTAADTEKKSGRGRASGNARSVYGIKKLRELILELAVRGKLVPQDANDEPASDLLKRIQAEKAKLVAEGKIKKDKPLAAIGDDEKPFELPHGWEWVRLGNIIDYVNGYAFSSKDFTTQGVGVVKIGDIQNGRVEPDFMSRVSESSVTELDSKLQVINGDLVIAMSGATTGKLGFNETKEIFYLNQRVGKIVPFFVSKQFLYFDLTTKIADNLKKSFGSAIPNLSTEQINAIVTALPSITEQHRIVAKVDELMALCDQLEAQHSNAAEAHEKLVCHLLGTLTQTSVRPELVEGCGSTGSPRTEFEDNWQRIAAHFDTLFTTEASIDTLKQTLLQLAVMGKLVPQDSNDEPASELLKRIQAEKAKLVAECKIKKDKPLAPIGDDEKPFALSLGWEWARFDMLALGSEAGWSPQCLPTPREGDKWGVLKVSAVTWGQFNPDENKGLPDNLEARPEYEVKAGDFLISRANTAELVAKAVVVPSNAPTKLMMSDKIIRFIFSKKISSDFVNLINNSNFARDYYAKVAGGTSSSMKNVSREQIRNLAIALPPINEQHRIVAKVDELMILCDQLKTRITTANQQQQKLADVLVEQAVASS